MLKGIYICDIEQMGNRFNIWMNPETKNLFAIKTMDVPVNQNYVFDPYDGTKLMLEDTFSGLPK